MLSIIHAEVRYERDQGLYLHSGGVYRWGVSERRVNQYCAEGRIPGASRFGRSWAIPENAEKPSDPRFQEQRRDPDRTST